ncbi:hypothetical protein [Oleiagrimonas soli]|uniref:Adhesin n=1 Tax=Oleiagrimonas soli TaxID=1543381 RepID=A0A841KIY0_9GAMM|nr:hypothetical protein [Oleiagrimonas soli]MBB6185146.1 hypothetical protein [Oleiagrimonas soli]
MNKTMKRTVLAIAVTALFGGSAYAQSVDPHQGNNDSVSFEKDVSLNSDVTLRGRVQVDGMINVDSAAISIVNNRQTNGANYAENQMVTNDADVDGNAGRETSGNIGANVAAGDNNQQDNAAALSAADASFTFGMADSEVFVDQQGSFNQTLNMATTNQATIGNSAFRDASGNIGVNVTSGNNNQQKNAMAASVATSSFAQATVSSDQASGHNETINALYEDVYMTSVQVSLSGSGSGSYSGSGQGSADLGLSGAVDQIGDVYPDTWTGDAHPAGSQTGHIDLDTATQGGSDLNGDGGALAFGFTDDSSASGGLGFEESGDVALDNINLSGTVNYLQISYLPTTNTASLGGNAFRGASGNIGINVSAGTGNQQANSLAMAVAQPSTGGGNGGGGE